MDFLNILLLRLLRKSCTSSFSAAATVVLLAVACRFDGVEKVRAASGPLIPALFAFGDSLIDAGNNNNLRSLAKANHPPYGQDLPSHKPTGRFTDGYTALDYFALKVGLPSPPIHSDPSTTGVRLLQGVNFASGASGIMPYAGLNFGKVFSIDAQIQQFAQVKQQIVALIGANATERLLYRSIFYIVSGSNDWLNTYFFPGSPLPHLYTRTQYRDVLIDKLISQVKELYNLGVRNIALTGLPAFGCAPSQLRAYKSVNGTCIAWLNDLARDYNDHLRPRLLGLVDELPDSGFAFQNTYEALETVLRDPAAYGYTVVDTACCGIGKYGGFLNCFQGFPVCKDVQTHLFWDAYHSISRFNEQLVDMVWNNGPPYSYPYSGKDLINLLREKRL